jgi:hypothetical protein
MSQPPPAFAYLRRKEAEESLGVANHDTFTRIANATHCACKTRSNGAHIYHAERVKAVAAALHAVRKSGQKRNLLYKLFCARPDLFA